ncbi:hypothetical protein FJT64_026945 [Amphibalanus amphitrite]|uniref:C-type lectin domain-containing protein n=1 Tax=Amphibalanus amphitrite TaxID=1232801 RepID=A0A6A4W283_AMPAM|nr:hypothetical protein FJT64_026945 [Amphibalanus amphitrite]
MVVVVATAVAACPDSTWHQEGDTCYKVFAEQTQNWPDSEEQCERWGTLANILSSDTNRLLSGLLTASGQSRAWIGLTNIGHADWYEWTDTHRAPEFSAWGTGPVNNQ